MSDAWIFLSIGDAGGCYDWVQLDELIRAADSNNHTIPTIGELEGSISKLTAAGLIEADGTHTKLTELGCKTFREANAPTVGHIKRMFDLGVVWKKRGYPPDAPKSWWLDGEAYRQACSDYRAWFQEAYARLKAKDNPQA